MSTLYFSQTVIVLLSVCLGEQSLGEYLAGTPNSCWHCWVVIKVKPSMGQWATEDGSFPCQLI